MIAALKVIVIVLSVLLFLGFIGMVILAALVWIDGGFDESSQTEDFYTGEDEDISWGEVKP